ncbi:MAG: alkaline phosphatase [Marivita sp.]|uniref:alkaline phosphatase n=1 Tax=Marivita sp. TaxID=2003365 RepID=UPI001B173573|nr:alkaline phosphatase [Marivita sp.]MBO6883041.1 alkaline phosphatase [Marivita sp.]
MKKTIVASVLALTAAGAVYAQDLPQADNEWFVAGQARLQAELAKQVNTNRALNVILLISDGNGVGTNYASRLFAGQQEGGFGDEYVQPFEAFPNLALVKTYNVNAQTPDSAGTGTAMMSGVKTKAGIIGVNENVVRGDCSTLPGNTVASMNEIMTEMGKETGIVSTARITHATPASAYAKSVDRNFEASVPEGCDTQKDIATQLIDAMEAGIVDVAMGGGLRNFHSNEGGRREDGVNLIERAQSLGAHFASDQASFEAAPLDGTPILGLFENSHMMYEADRADEPSLAEMTAAAISALSAKASDNGYFLQVEAGRVDHANHAGNLARVVRDQKAFADAVAMADEMTDDADTLIIVTADHEHAISFNGYCGRGSNILGLCMGIDGSGVGHNGEPELASDGKPYTVAGYLNGPGSVLIEQPDGSFFGTRPNVTEENATDLDYPQQALVPKSSETHAGEDVAVYAKGPWAHLLDGTIEQNVIFHVMHHAATVE